MPSAYANDRSRYYGTLLYLVNKYGYTKKFNSVHSNIDGHMLSAMDNRGLFDPQGNQKICGRRWEVKVYKIKKIIFDQVVNQERKLGHKCQNDITL